MSAPDTFFKITTEIRSLLIANEDIAALVGDKVFPVVAPADTKGDFIVYQRDNYTKDYSKMGISDEQCKVYISVVSKEYERSQELAYLVNSYLEGDWKDPDMQIRLIDSTEDFEDQKYIQVLLFKISNNYGSV